MPEALAAAFQLCCPWCRALAGGTVRGRAVPPGQRAPAHKGAESDSVSPCGTRMYVCASKKKSTLKRQVGSGYHFVIPRFCPKVQDTVQLERAEIKAALLSLKCEHYPCLTSQLKESCRCGHRHQTMPVHAPFMSCEDGPLTTGQYITKKKIEIKSSH